jgi:hypothetical protein
MNSPKYAKDIANAIGMPQEDFFLQYGHLVDRGKIAYPVSETLCSLKLETPNLTPQEFSLASNIPINKTILLVEYGWLVARNISKTLNPRYLIPSSEYKRAEEQGILELTIEDIRTGPIHYQAFLKAKRKRKRTAKDKTPNPRIDEIVRRLEEDQSNEMSNDENN